MSKRPLLVLSTLVLFAGAIVLAGRTLMAAERRPPQPPILVEDPAGGGNGPIVAVIDTGVDVRHPALKDCCLPGINVAEPDQPCEDMAGHGTAVAGLIASADAEADFRGVASGIARILPVKVTPSDSREALPASIAMGIEKALDAKAAVICIAMGSPRSSKSLDEAIERAKKEGVLVVAAAGVGDGAADLWPAMHPWVVSCTISEMLGITRPDGTEDMAEYPASRAHISGKTELIGKGFAKVLAPAGGHGQLEGSSVPCAKAAGVAAAVKAKFPEATIEQLRRLLTLSGEAMEAGNIFYTYPARRFSRDAATAVASQKDKTDLALTYVDVNPGPLEPDQPGKLEFSVTNIGFAPAAGEVEFEAPKDKVKVTAKFDAVPPGETKVVTVELPALKEGLHRGIALLRSGTDRNAANDRLAMDLRVQKLEGAPIVVQRPRLVRFRSGEKKAVVEFEVVNARDGAFEADAAFGVKDSEFRQPIKFTKRETKTVSIEVEFPDLADKKRAYGTGCGVMKGDETVAYVDLDILGKNDPAVVQYADAWGTKEVIIDAPAFVLEGRESIPVLLFAPEVHTLIDEDLDGRTKVSSKGPRQRRAIWLYDISLEELDPNVALSTRFEWWRPPPSSYGGKILLHVEGDVSRPAQFPERTNCAKGVFIESAVGAPVLAPEDLIHFVDEDGWSSVVNVPLSALRNSAEPLVYLRGGARYLDRARSPFEATWRNFDSGPAYYQTVLRVRLHATLPRLDPKGQYYDVHVHTQCEFSRDAVEPRLAWGGPLWMLVRTAHAMGFVEEDYVAAVRHGDFAAVASKEQLFTTDHNCFLTDNDTPTALPFRDKEAEISTLRRFFGKGANQELAMAPKGGRPLGAPHALTYGSDAIPGPWHGGRNFGSGLKKVKSILDELKDHGILKLAGKALPELLRALRDNGDLRHEVLEKINKALKKKDMKEISADGFAELCKVWGDFDESKINELVDQADRVLSAAATRGETNGNTVQATETRLAATGTFIAAHPMAGPSLNWDLDDLDRAANVVGGPFPDVQVAGRFPFAGVQAWNEEPLQIAKMESPEQLRQFNPWAAQVMSWNQEWHQEWAQGFLYYEGRMAKPGMMFTFDEKELRRRYFIRKLYHYAGSDAHGAFNFTTGVGATLLSNKDLAPVLKIFGQGHGTTTHSSHYGCARVYAQKPLFEEVYRGRVVCTDGPLAWFDVDSDVKFDANDLVWHESWEAPKLAQDVDGQIGGDGAFDGKRTALVRRNCPEMVLRYRVAKGGPTAPSVQRLDLYRLEWNDETTPKEIESYGGVMVPRPQDKWKPGEDESVQYRAVKPWAPSGPALFMVAGFSRWLEDSDDRYDTRGKRCFTNPIWLTTVEIGASARPIVQDGKAFIPKGAFVATFRADHSMREEAPVILAKQFNNVGDSVAATYKLVPVVTDDGIWRPEPRKIGEKDIEVDDCVLVAVNDQAIPLGPPWYPFDGVDTFAVILAGAKDMHGNPYNAIASKVEVGVPAGTVITPDTSGPGDPSGGNDGKPVETGHAGRPADTATVTVKPGDKIDLPKGATCDGKPVPAGAFTVPDLPDKGLSLVVSCGAQTLTLLLTTAASSNGPWLDRGSKGYYGAVPTPGQGPAKVTLKNHSKKTVEFPQPVVVTPTTCVFSAPEAETGTCDVTIEQGGAKSTSTVEAVAALLTWDKADAQVGDLRVLSLVLEGASKPADWVVFGPIAVQNAEIVEADPRLQRLPDGSFVASGLPGDAGVLLRVKAVKEGAMTATSGLRAEKK